ncbi:hypothetical protein CDA63_03990 [Hymenobacter amundsenii]|uniref:Uncharacterized protein n=1 Tax=Hymenobacter amundsenii TaxID=2006685 RepID=A0A246FP81_9BACT|nr:hypothetical protein [Hymenobacter amundsenii]OWP64538.1 hypothetical protein CDA63_03990 [Hymenobacter amundsenii]
MKYFLPITGLLALLACEREPTTYKKTQIPLPSRMSIFTLNQQLDSTAKPLKPDVLYVPYYISRGVETELARYANGRIDRVYSLKEKSYHLNDTVNAFVITAILTRPQETVDYVGIYKDGNFDYQTSSVKFADSTATSAHTDITKLESGNREFKVTYISKSDGYKSVNRVSFKDMLNQFLRYKLEFSK